MGGMDQEVDALCIVCAVGGEKWFEGVSYEAWPSAHLGGPLLPEAADAST